MNRRTKPAASFDGPGPGRLAASGDHPVNASTARSATVEMNLDSRLSTYRTKFTVMFTPTLAKARGCTDDRHLWHRVGVVPSTCRRAGQKHRGPWERRSPRRACRPTGATHTAAGDLGRFARRKFRGHRQSCGNRHAAGKACRVQLPEPDSVAPIANRHAPPPFIACHLPFASSSRYDGQSCHRGFARCRHTCTVPKQTKSSRSLSQFDSGAGQLHRQPRCKRQGLRFYQIHDIAARRKIWQLLGQGQHVHRTAEA